MSDTDYIPSPSGWVRDQVEKIEATGDTRSVHVLNRPVVMLTMVGAKTGGIRKVPLMRVEHEGSYALVASFGGRPENPAWYANLVADPNVMIQDGPEPHDFVVREVSGAERDAWWQRGVAVFPTYDEYQSKTDRTIPVLVAEPVA